MTAAMTEYRHIDGRLMGAYPGSALELHLQGDADWTPIEAAVEGDGLDALSRADLDARAADLGIEDADRLPNKAAVVEAIRAATADADGREGTDA